MRYDSLGRMVLNVEPNTSKSFTTNLAVSATTSAEGLKAWRYAYDDAGDLVGTSDARGCGVNFDYDGAGRLLSEDYSPCEAHHELYSPPSHDEVEGPQGSKCSTTTTRHPKSPTPASSALRGARRSAVELLQRAPAENAESSPATIILQRVLPQIGRNRSPSYSDVFARTTRDHDLIRAGQNCMIRAATTLTPSPITVSGVDDNGVLYIEWRRAVSVASILFCSNWREPRAGRQVPGRQRLTALESSCQHSIARIVLQKPVHDARGTSARSAWHTNCFQRTQRLNIVALDMSDQPTTSAKAMAASRLVTKNGGPRASGHRWSVQGAGYY